MKWNQYLKYWVVYALTYVVIDAVCNLWLHWSGRSLLLLGMLAGDVLRAHWHDRLTEATD